jgi:hypothetical protein
VTQLAYENIVFSAAGGFMFGGKEERLIDLSIKKRE